MHKQHLPHLWKNHSGVHSLYLQQWKKAFLRRADFTFSPSLTQKYNLTIKRTLRWLSIIQILWYFQNTVLQRLESLQIYIVMWVHCVWKENFTTYLLTAYYENTKPCQRICSKVHCNIFLFWATELPGVPDTHLRRLLPSGKETLYRSYKLFVLAHLAAHHRINFTHRWH